MLRIKVFYENAQILSFLCPSNEFDVKFSDEPICHITGEQEVTLDIEDQICSKDIIISTYKLDNKEMIFRDNIVIKTTYEIQNEFLEFHSKSAFSIQAVPGWNNNIWYSRDMTRWTKWTGGSISSKQYEDEHYLFFKGDTTRIAISPENAWVITGSAECNGNLKALLATSGITNYTFAYWLKGANITKIPNIVFDIIPPHAFESTFEGCSLLETTGDITASQIQEYGFYKTFKGSGIKFMPYLIANKIEAHGCESMFEGSQLKIYNFYDSDAHAHSFKIPNIGDTFSGKTDWNLNMFKDTLGDFTGDPYGLYTYYMNSEINHTFYTISYSVLNTYGTQPNYGRYEGEQIVFDMCYLYSNSNIFKSWEYNGNFYQPGNILYVNKDMVINSVWEPASYAIDRMVGEFLLNNTTYDSSKHEQILTINEPIYVTEGNRTCLAGGIGFFDNENLIGAFDWSLSFWFNYTTPVGDNDIFVGEDNLLTSEDGIQFLLYKDNLLQSKFRSLFFPFKGFINDKWYNLTYTYNRDEKRLSCYINGQPYLVQENFEMTNREDVICINKIMTPEQNPFKLDDFRFYQKALSPSEIISIYKLY